MYCGGFFYLTILLQLFDKFTYYIQPMNRFQRGQCLLSSIKLSL